MTIKRIKRLMGLVSQTVFTGALLSQFAVADSLTSVNVAGIPLFIQASAEQQVQRQLFLDAENALKHRNYKQFQANLEQLKDYPLKPYLDYQYLSARLYPKDDVTRFLQQEDGTYLADRLRKRWLYNLAKRGRWNDFTQYYSNELASTELACYSLQARLATGDMSAFNDVPELWNVGKSQPKACDLPFATWIKAGQLTPELAWERYSKTLENRQYALANYLTRNLDPQQKIQAALFKTVIQKPEVLVDVTRFGSQNKETQAIIVEGIKRLSRKNSELAWQTWQRYDAQQFFTDEDRRETSEYLGLQLILDGHMQAAEALTSTLSSLTSVDLLEAAIRQSLKQQDWVKVNHYIQQLSAEDQQQPVWQYWLARSQQSITAPGPVYPTAESIYMKLSIQRDFYGFLAADQINQGYSFRDNPSTPEESEIEAIANNPAIQRARELLALNRINDARREWFSLSRELNPQAAIAAGVLAQRWGWHRITIQSMAQAEEWDDLNARFPLAYDKHVHAAADQQKIQPTFLFAIARQESAFAPDALSSAGAMGLMQLMPGTAKDSAKRSGISFNHKYDLLQPDKNIALGSFYISELLSKFGGNRILAIAAYNAGPNRVQAWLNAEEAEKLPYDIWIETIPFRETRKYVKNVLAYSVIYAYRMGEHQAVITQEEAGRKL